MFTAVSAQSSFFLALLFLGLGSLGSACLWKKDAAANWWGNLCAITASVFGLLSAIRVLLGGAAFSLAADSPLGALSFSFTVDKLSAFFIFVISLIALPASIYGLGYVKHYYGRYSPGVLGFFYNLFLAGLFLVVSADNALFFLTVWEIMSLASYFLVIFEHREPDNISAGTRYFIMTHAGTACIILAFLVLYRFTGSFEFDVIRENFAAVPAYAKNIVFLLTLAGFGTKAGIIPLHIWLPSAHPAAPTHVSALMSGVMIKTGIYMFIRILIDFSPGAPLWWGIAVLLIGAASSLFGVLYALTEHDIKKLLAYHSIENIGIILLGLGSALVFWAAGAESLAMLGLIAALFHTLNHAVFKALLFLGAGSVISQTRTRNMEEYGGLIRTMPYTAALFLTGSLAISALPPFNGFASEWLTFQSLFSGFGSFGRSVAGVFALSAGALAFTGGLAAACFVKAFGATFLARPRSVEAARSRESAPSMVLGMGVLALLTLVIGIFSGVVSRVLSVVVADRPGFSTVPVPVSVPAASLSLGSGFAAMSLPLVFVSLAAVSALVAFLTYLATAGRRVKIGRTWDCGTDLTPRMEITATGFSRSLISIFRGILKPSKQTTIEYRDADSRFFPQTRSVKLEIKDVYSAYFYRPVERLTMALAAQIKKIQCGNVNAYIVYLFAALIALLVWAVI
ncbi:MAG: Formate hydrogenlyase subunit 3/multisubunit Na+/H+ antiporter, MnhD subunit [Candidatus Magasanikbacteria bacterium GW2011_GWA2_56_11]|uniref:Formate hydrogenlyase subunit 3/multisubunit Na+/H+ antiporter, MnhD subunit n=1 Tax=Candidatus Magasanikbacteria bacterium GW2011_GWA2_56_11 TaxID=1619044 RepID=A0A0G2AMF2_9BACT|nr:MAG: Formate hydrogenlyase subunit 3/multisubunit Na+/H+ antiporter, MnhD subunit [Candidatus Magasanikbacteria bacterium GW2011_GWA2_56_11]